MKNSDVDETVRLRAFELAIGTLTPILPFPDPYE